jgi:hypothetical protein
VSFAARRSMVGAVQADLAEMGELRMPGGRTFAAIALLLAEVIDSAGADGGPSVTVKIASELRATMTALVRKGGDANEAFEDYVASLSLPESPKE